MEGEFVAENLATLDGNLKEDVLKYLDDIKLKQQDVLVLLVAGQDVFIQPYKGDYITSTLPQQKDGKSDNTQDKQDRSQEVKNAFLSYRGGEKQ